MAKRPVLVALPANALIPEVPSSPPHRHGHRIVLALILEFPFDPGAVIVHQCDPETAASVFLIDHIRGRAEADGGAA